MTAYEISCELVSVRRVSVRRVCPELPEAERPLPGSIPGLRSPARTAPTTHEPGRSAQPQAPAGGLRGGLSVSRDESGVSGG